MMRTCKRSLQVATCLALAACAQTPAPAINDKVVQVNIPVAVKCVDPARIPAPVPPTVLTGDAKHDVSVLAKVDLALRSAVDQLTALVSPCTVDPNPPAQSSSNP